MGWRLCRIFFSHLSPQTGAAYIVVQHLSPDFKSMMSELLSKQTKMPIHHVTDGMVLEANTVYLMPPRKNMLIAEGKLLLSDQMPDNQLHTPIDFFFRSLAEDQQDKAVGIVLSGTGSDGTRGIKAMKESGGLVIVQEPGSAKFDGMPINAVNTGLADMVMQPKDMGRSLLHFIKRPGQKIVVNDNSVTNSENEDFLSEIFQMLKAKSSINFNLYKASTVARRIERRMVVNQISSLESYLGFLIDSPRELQALSKELLIGVTRFFRDDDVFARLTKEVIPKVVERAVRKKEAVRLWIAGCSTGEEAYSLAILVLEYMKAKNMETDVKIFATDVDEEAIAEASQGVFSTDIEQDVSAERLENFFEKQDKHYTVTQQLRQSVIFATHNVIEDPPFSNIDLVSCRNVLIYFQHAAQKKVLSSLFFSLNKHGYLVLGSSESLGDHQSHFETVDERSKIFMKISNSRVPLGSSPPSKEMTTGADNHPIRMSPIPTVMRTQRLAPKSGMTVVLEKLVKEYAPDCIVLNDTFEAIHVFGNVRPFTKGMGPGKISNNIKDIVVDELSVAVTTALYRSEKNESDVFYKDVLVNTADSQQVLIDLSVFYIKDSELPNASRNYIVQFISHENENVAQHTAVSFDASEQSRQRIQDLELELIKKQEHLQVTVEELETTNEELQSANEELMSANEELQSTNEELQSVNEELYTVNSEYQEKISELTQANSDLDSVINATNIGIIFLDEQLTIRKFTPSATKYINLRSSDIGRPFHHISHELEYEQLLADVATVSNTHKIIEKDLLSANKQALLVRIAPYSKSHNATAKGVLITITNISRQRFIEKALHVAQEQLRSSLLDTTEHLLNQGERTEVKVLILDDEPSDLIKVKRMLDSVAERKVISNTFSELDEAEKACTESDFDICLVDYNLAGTTAMEFSKKLTEKDIHTPMIVLSGYSEVNLDKEFFDPEVFDFLNKEELSPQLLIRSIDYVLERKSVRDALQSITIKT